MGIGQIGVGIGLIELGIGLIELPHLQYCLINWGNCKGDRNIGLRDRILTLQKSLVRIICGAGRISHADPLFAELATLKVDDLFAQSVRIFSYKLSKGMLPGSMASMLSKADHNYSTRGARSNFFVSHSDTRSIRSIAPRYWNSLSSPLKESVSIATFKEKSKLDLLMPYNDFTCNVQNCRSCTSCASSR